MCNADGDFLLVPQLGVLRVQTEFGWLVVPPGHCDTVRMLTGIHAAKLLCFDVLAQHCLMMGHAVRSLGELFVPFFELFVPFLSYLCHF